MHKGGRWRLFLTFMIQIQPSSSFNDSVKLLVAKSRREALELCANCEYARNTNNYGTEQREPEHADGNMIRPSGYIRQKPKKVQEQNNNASGGVGAKLILNPKDFGRRKFKRGYLINAERKLRNRNETTIKFKQYPKKKKFKPYTNKNCYMAMRMLQTSIENRKKDFVSLVSKAAIARVPNIDQTTPKLFIIKAWQRASSNKFTPYEQNSGRLCNKPTLHRQARALDMELDWTAEDDAAQQFALDVPSRKKLLDLLFHLAAEIQQFSYLETGAKFLHASCRFVRPEMRQSPPGSKSKIDRSEMIRQEIRSVEIV